MAIPTFEREVTSGSLIDRYGQGLIDLGVTAEDARTKMDHLKLKRTIIHPYDRDGLDQKVLGIIGFIKTAPKPTRCILEESAPVEKSQPVSAGNR